MMEAARDDKILLGWLDVFNHLGVAPLYNSDVNSFLQQATT